MQKRRKDARKQMSEEEIEFEKKWNYLDGEREREREREKEAQAIIS